MYLVVDADWARKHPREAARIQVAHLLRRVQSKRVSGTRKGTEGRNKK
jgi:hypothetical protein